MADENTSPKKSGSSWLKGALKWTFRVAVMGVGLGIGSELISEFFVGGLIHGTAPLAHSIFQSSVDFVDPIMQRWSDNIVASGQTIEGFMSPFIDFLQSIHEFFGIDDTFNNAAAGTEHLMGGTENIVDHTPPATTLHSTPSSTNGSTGVGSSNDDLDLGF